jgi:hypothetical protein
MTASPDIASSNPISAKKKILGRLTWASMMVSVALAGLSLHWIVDILAPNRTAIVEAFDAAVMITSVGALTYGFFLIQKSISLLK